ncbi:MAG: tetratricopeptide repeat protein [Ktedonobacteraceae bacterium]
MPELVLQRTADTLEVTLGEHHASVPGANVAPDATMGKRIYDDAIAYGKDLFEKTFPAGPLRTALTALRTNERLVLVIDDPSLAAIPWEYLRDPEGRLLAGRLTLVRSVSGAHQNAELDLTLPLHIVAVPVSPVDDPRVLDTEGEWQRVMAAVSKQGKMLTLTRVRPPTLDLLERTLHSERTTLIHFMGHSDSREGKGLLVFEEAHGRSYLVDASDFADSLVATNIFLVVLNSCRSAVAWDWTSFGNIARGLVREGVPYALGMQFVLPDDVALAMSQALYDFLLQGRSIEEAVRRTRRALEHNTNLHNTSWLAGIPVLYTSLREQPAAPLKLTGGQPGIQPDPERLQKTCDLTALPQATHFVGRSKEISAVLDALLASRPANFVVLHGLGGIGKTSVALAVAERIGWHYDDRVLAISFETFARLDANNQRVVDDTFADRFYNRVARFYELDPAQYPTSIELQQAILQRRAHVRSLLVCDNIETLIDTQKDHPAARSLATFISRLKEGNGPLLLTSRVVPPSDWGESQVIELPGLEDAAGADLFFALLPADREHLAPPADRLALSQRVQGHPLSIRLLAGRFAETTTDLATFLQQSETELEVAEQATPTSLEDPDRQRTLYACMDYSIRRLTPEQRMVLETATIFQAPFLAEFAAHVLNDEPQTPLHLQNLVRLGLLTRESRTFKEGELIFFEVHSMLRWYIQNHLTNLDAAQLERYGEVYEQLTRRAYQFEEGYDQSSLMRYLIRQSLPDCEVALEHLPKSNRSSLAFHLASLYERRGQNRHTLELYEQALELYQDVGDKFAIGRTEYAMARVLVLQGRPQEALVLYEKALRTSKELGNIRNVAVTQSDIADVLVEQGLQEEALSLYEQALQTVQKLGDVRSVAITQHSMANLLFQQGKPQEALSLYKKALQIAQELGDVRSIAIMRHAVARVLVRQGRLQEALTLYEQVKHTFEELGDMHGIAIIKNSQAEVLILQGHRQEALLHYEQALHILQELGNVREATDTQRNLANLLVNQGCSQEAFTLYKQVLLTAQELGDVRGVAGTQQAIGNILVEQGRSKEALLLYGQSLQTALNLEDLNGIATTQCAIGDLLVEQGHLQEALVFYERSLLIFKELDYAGDIADTQKALASTLLKKGRLQEALALYKEALYIDQELGNMSDVSITQQAIAVVLVRQGRLQEALTLYEQALSNLQELGDMHGVAVIQANFSQLLFQQGEHPRALLMAWEAYTSLRQHGFSYDAQLMQQLLISIKGQVLGPEKFDMLWKQVMSEPQPDWLRDVQASSAGSITSSVSGETMQAVRDFVNADDWDATRQVLEAQQVLLFQSEVEALFEQNITQARSAGEERTVRMLELHLALLRECKANGIAPAFAKLAALLGGPQEKMEHMQYLAAIANESTDEDLKALINTIQLALFSKDLSQFGRDLKGVYRQAWEAIVATVEDGGVDPDTFNTIINNTLAVLGPASNQRSEWRNNLVQARNSATAGGNRNMVALLDAVIALLDAGGNAADLGAGLKDIYAQTWQAIVENLAT